MKKKATISEQELVTLLKIKDEASFKYLYDHYSGALYPIISSIIPDKEIANDVLQELFVVIWQKIGSYDAMKGKLFTWMLSIARNLAVDMVRSSGYRNNRNNHALSDEVYFDASTFTTYRMLDKIGLKKAVEKLKPEHRSLIELAYYKGYTQEGIAELESLPVGTVKSRIRSALLQLRAHFI